MKFTLAFLRLLIALCASGVAAAQTLPGDNVVFGPMMSPVYGNSVRVWVLTENTGSGRQLTLELAAANGASGPIAGTVHQSDERLGYSLRSYLYTGLAADETYTATIRVDGQPSVRSATIKNEVARVDDFSFLSGGCGRIFDLSRCIDRPESQTHKNGDPAIFNRMAQEDSDLMVWLGDATYLLGLQHAGGQCPDAIDDWANKDTAFARYMFYRQFHDKLLQSMPQLAITDNHDTGPNEFNKTLPSLNEMKEVFMQWWPNPEYRSTLEGQGLFSSYRYKDAEYFLLDNRSYRDDTRHHLGPEQFEWLKQALLDSTATYKILINGTPSFAKHWGGRNFSVTEQGDQLVQFIQDQNIDGVLSFSADIHEQEFYGRYGGVNYPLFDVLSGNLNSDVGDGNFTVDYGSDSILRGVKQTYLKTSVYGQAGDRRLKVQYMDLDGHPYFESIIHEDMLKSDEADTLKLALSFSGNLHDDSANDVAVTGTASYEADRHGTPASAARLGSNGLIVDRSTAPSLEDRTFSIGFWIKPAMDGTSGSVVFSNGSATGGVTLGIDAYGHPTYVDHASGQSFTVGYAAASTDWQHIFWEYDNVKRTLAFYHNGLLAQSWSNVLPPKASNADLRLGNGLGGHLQGLLDEFYIYGKLLPEEIIKELADYEPSDNFVLQLSGAQNVAIPADQINPALSGDFSIEFWGRVNADPATSGKILASNSRVDGNTTGISFEFSADNRLNAVLGTNTNGWNATGPSGAPWQVGEWNHVAVTAARGGDMTLYINGEPVGRTSFTGYVANPTGLGLGDSPYYGSDIRAEMDELRVWNRALEASEIQANMHIPLSGAGSDLVFYYDFDTVDTIVPSKGSNAYALELVGASIVDGSAPVHRLPLRYRDTTAASWSVRNDVSAGLYLVHPVANLNSNVIIGHHRQVNALRLPSHKGTYYLKGAWLLHPTHMTGGDLSIDLGRILDNPEAITGNASQYWLLQGHPWQRKSKRFAGTAVGNVVSFSDVPLRESATYYLLWKTTRHHDHPPSARPRSHH